MAKKKIRYLVCKVCGKRTKDSKSLDHILYPNDYCNVAIRLKCGHWMFDDCDPKGKIKNGMCIKSLLGPGQWKYPKRV